jgi:hypothetical protein
MLGIRSAVRRTAVSGERIRSIPFFVASRIAESTSMGFASQLVHDTTVERPPEDRALAAQRSGVVNFRKGGRLDDSDHSRPGRGVQHFSVVARRQTVD